MYGTLTRQLHGIPWFSSNYAPYLSWPLSSNLSHGGYDNTPYSFNATSIAIQCNRPILVPKISKFKCYYCAQGAHEISEMKWNEWTIEISNIYGGLSSHHGPSTLFRYWLRHMRGQELEVPVWGSRRPQVQTRSFQWWRRSRVRNRLHWRRRS